jgi:hypothetical protein
VLFSPHLRQSPVLRFDLKSSVVKAGNMGLLLSSGEDRYCQWGPLATVGRSWADWFGFPDSDGD